MMGESGRQPGGFGMNSTAVSVCVCVSECVRV